MTSKPWMLYVPGRVRLAIFVVGVAPFALLFALDFLRGRLFDFWEIDMKLIDDVKGAWRHFSTIALAAGAALQGVWIAFPDDLKAQLPLGAVKVVSYLTACILVWGLIGKFIKQPDAAGTRIEPT